MRDPAADVLKLRAALNAIRHELQAPNDYGHPKYGGMAAVDRLVTEGLEVQELPTTARMVTPEEATKLQVLLDQLFETGGDRATAARAMALELGIDLTKVPPPPLPELGVERTTPVMVRFGGGLYAARVRNVEIRMHHADPVFSYDGRAHYEGRPRGVTMRLDLDAYPVANSEPQAALEEHHRRASEATAGPSTVVPTDG